MAEKKPDFDLDPDPASTYGKSPEYIEAWNAKYNKDNAGEAPGPSADASGAVSTADADQASGQADTAASKR